MPVQLPLDKAALRRSFLDQRKSLSDPYSAALGLADNLCLVLFQRYAPLDGKIVAGYWPMRAEIDPLAAMERLAKRGARLALPVVLGPGRPLVFRAWKPGDLLDEGAFKTRHPSEHQPVLIPDLLLVPMVAFDPAGNRLGYGGGFYDRTLEQLRAAKPTVAIGIAHATQQADALPAEDHDQPLDWVITDQGAFGPF